MNPAMMAAAVGPRGALLAARIRSLRAVRRMDLQIRNAGQPRNGEKRR